MCGSSARALRAWLARRRADPATGVATHGANVARRHAARLTSRVLDGVVAGARVAGFPGLRARAAARVATDITGVARVLPARDALQ